MSKSDKVIERLIYYCVVFIPAYYYLIITPFLYNESGFFQFISRSMTIHFLFLITYYILNSNTYRLRLFVIRSPVLLYIFPRILMLTVLLYFVFGFAVIGFNGVYNNCHYCGPRFLGAAAVNIIVFDLGNVIVCILAYRVIACHVKLSVYNLVLFVACGLVVYFYINGTYRNQLIVIIFACVAFWCQRYRSTKIMPITLFVLPFGGLFMSFFHYDTTETFLEFILKNEFYSGYRNYQFVLSGFDSSQISYVGIILLQLDKIGELIDYSYMTIGGEFARYMWSSDGIKGVGYGFSPLAEAIVNFGNFYFIGGFILGISFFLVKVWCIDVVSEKWQIVCFGILVYYLFNLFRIDFSAATNILIHKYLLLYLLIVLERRGNP